MNVRNVPLCTHILESGRPCRAVALARRPFCRAHHRLRQRTRQQLRAQRPPEFRLGTMHTPGDIQRTRLRILVAMGEQVIDPDRAYELLRRVQIANSKIERLAASRRALLGRTCSFLFLCIAITRVFGAA